ncbi:MAG: protoheme IX farnesyltransferase [Buchnera aphidicola (Periphyllus acericola)]|uniref:heme o synthase n=1 Tax=Buchnera aphidicola TaxID=9 RepID=UPI0030D22B2E|nr:protoheme IX farnesyltransferase [Buchnera aphidicola (Periphyllus acericola)]
MLYLFKYFTKNFLYFFELIKPRILFSNLFSSVSGYFFGIKNNSINYSIFFFMIFGLFFIISCGCVLNNILDRKCDRQMKRTMNRVLAKKKISIKESFIFSIILFILGTFFLCYFVSKIVFLISFFGLFVYVFLYTFLLKKKYPCSTIVGAFSGSCPILIGYLSVLNYDIYIGLLLFLIFFIWQIPHSYSVSLLNFKDYKNANIKVFPIIYSFEFTLDNMYFFVNLLIFFNFIFSINSNLNKFHLIIFIILGFFWLFYITKGYNIFLNYSKWLLKIFKFSIFYIFIFNISICINYI